MDCCALVRSVGVADGLAGTSFDGPAGTVPTRVVCAEVSEADAAGGCTAGVGATVSEHPASSAMARKMAAVDRWARGKLFEWFINILVVRVRNKEAKTGAVASSTCQMAVRCVTCPHLTQA